MLVDAFNNFFYITETWADCEWGRTQQNLKKSQIPVQTSSHLLYHIFNGHVIHVIHNACL